MDHCPQTSKTAIKEEVTTYLDGALSGLPTELCQLVRQYDDPRYNVLYFSYTDFQHVAEMHPFESVYVETVKGSFTLVSLSELSKTPEKLCIVLHEWFDMHSMSEAHSSTIDDLQF